MVALKNDARLDPTSEQFDKELYTDLIERFRETVQTSHDLVKENAQQIGSMVSLGEDTLTKLHEVIQFLLHNVVVANDGFRNVFPQDMLENARQIVKQVEENFFSFVDGAQELADLIPYIEEELKENYQGLTFDQLIEEVELDDNNTPVKGTRYEKVLKAATYRKLMAERNLPTISATKRSDFEAPVDKVDNTMWKLYEQDTHTAIDGQISVNTIAIAVESSIEARKGIERNIMYSISFSELADDNPVMKRLTPFDKRVYFAIANLYAVGNDYLTVKMIYKEMGNTKNPSQAQREKILTSIKKMMGAVITLSNLEELANIEYTDPKTGKKKTASAYNYNLTDYNGNLLYAEFTEGIVNGKQTETIHIIKVPILYEFAKSRGQITTFKREVLQLPLSQTDDNLLLQDYLIEEIQRIRKGKRDAKMLFSTIYDNCNIKTKMQISRAKEKIYACLDYWTTDESKHFIKGYSKLKDGVEIHC